jgi:predicted ArsR family transcriptional regulator
MSIPRQLMEYLKQHGPSTIKELMAHLGLSETAVRHQLSGLEKSGWLAKEKRRLGKGRPATVYRLTQASEGLFPKRYPELLDAVLAEAEREGIIERLLEGVAESMASELRRKLEGLEGSARGLANLYGLRRDAGYPGRNPHRLGAQGPQLLLLRHWTALRSRVQFAREGDLQGHQPACRATLLPAGWAAGLPLLNPEALSLVPTNTQYSGSCSTG